MKDWSSTKVGLLKPLYISGSKNGAVWMCLCDCGNKVERTARSLQSAVKKGYQNTSCGCMKSNQKPELVEAIKNNRDRYFTGEPCKHGHVSERRVKGRQCVECARLKDLETRPGRLDYFKKYQKENPEKSREAIKRYNKKHREKRLKYDAKYRSCSENKKKRSEWQRSRYHAKRAQGGGFTRHEVNEIHKKQKGFCAHCCKKLSDYHVDHVIPISKGGENKKENLQILCPTCNLQKGSKDPIQWANENGKLL